MGVRSKRYAMILEDGVVKHLAIDEKGATTTTAQALLNKL
jgi:peroxiredoxin